MTDDTRKNQKESIAGRFRRLLAPEGNCGCCGGVKVVPKKTDEKKE